jgi:drug/metabolite transporter (DMT)-like permease
MSAARHAKAAPLAVTGLLLNATVWGMSWIPFRALNAAGLHPLWSTVGIYMGAFAFVMLWKWRALSSLPSHPGLLWLAIGAGLTNALFNSAVAVSDVVRVVLLFYLMPVWVALLARLVLREPITPRSLTRVFLGLAGAALVLYQPGSGFPLPGSLADWAALAAGACFALNNVMLRRLAHVDEGARAIAMFGGDLLFSLAAGGVLAMTGVVAWPVEITTNIGMTLAMWSLLMLVANLGLQYGAARLPSNLTSLIMLTEILVAALTAWWAGAAELRLQDIAGGLLILSAPWIIRDAKAPPH